MGLVKPGNANTRPQYALTASQPSPTMLAMMGVCIGGIASNLATGWLIEHAGPAAPYAIGGVGGIALALLLPLLLPRAKRPPPEPGEQPFSPAWS